MGCLLLHLTTALTFNLLSTYIYYTLTTTPSLLFENPFSSHFTSLFTSFLLTCRATPFILLPHHSLYSNFTAAGSVFVELLLASRWSFPHSNISPYRLTVVLHFCRWAVYLPELPSSSGPKKITNADPLLGFRSQSCPVTLSRVLGTSLHFY